MITKLVQHKTELILLGLLGIGFLLRFYGVSYGLPELWHPDEDAVLMPALEILRTGSWEPVRMEYGSFHIYLLVAVSSVVSVLLMREGFLGSAEDIPIYTRGALPSIYHRPEFFTAARLVSVLYGTLVILMIYLLAERLTGSKRQAIWAALFTAILPRFVVQSHFATTNMALMFWVTVALYLILRVYDNWETDSWWTYFGAGIVCGIATSTKYNGVLLVLPLLSIVPLRVRSWDELISWRTISGAIGMGLGFVAATPYVILALPEFLNWFGFSLRVYNVPLDLPVSSLYWHLSFHFRQSYAPVILLALIGIPLSFWKWGVRGLILNGFALFFWVTIAEQTNYQIRMWLPTAPVVMLWSALALDTLLTFIHQRIANRRYAHLLPYLLTALIALPMLYGAARLSYHLPRDGRRDAREWIEQNVPDGTPIAVDYFRPNVDPARWPVTHTFFLYDNPLSHYQEQGVEYFILHDAMNDFERQDAGREQLYEELIAQLCPVDAINAPVLGYNDYTIFIYRAPPCQ